MKIAITGGSGFIGQRLGRILQTLGHDVVVLDTAEETPVDVTDKAAVIKALDGVEVIYNLAAEHRDDVSPVQKYYDVNVGGARILAEAAAELDINRIIFTSTVAVYGLNAGESRESDAPDPFNDYGQSKLDAEQVFNAWADEDTGRSLTTIRLVATFGPGNRGNIYTLMNQIASGRFVMVGGGRNHKSVAYVENVAAFLAHTLSFGAGQHLYNYADKPDLNMREMVTDIRAALGLDGQGIKIPYALGLAGGMGFDVLAKLSGKTFPISAVRVRKFCADTMVNADALEATGFKRPYTLQDGLKAMIDADFQQAKKAA